MSQSLNQILNAALKFNGPDFYKKQVPEYVFANLRGDFSLRPYQKEAFGRFRFFWKDYHDRPRNVPTQLLFHMATGSGKTLVMAGLIIYLYRQGYRNFLFFVNSTNIIEKTRDNFFNSKSSKYLFADNIFIGEKKIRVKEVNNFQAANQEDINIVFSTIQGLHSRLNAPKENCLTYDDFKETKIVLISDEAHHINAETKKKNELNKDEIEDILSWECTVNQIFNANEANALLEFSATVDLSNPQIEAKYNDKLIFDYPLKQFRIDGYSKEVKVLQADLSKFDRALQGILLSQYRRKVFEKYKKLIKPVILFKSKTIKESQEFFDEFVERFKKLKASDLEKINNSNTDEAIAKLFKFFDDNSITLENLITELKEDFSEEKLISVNSKNESEEKQLAVNSLEDLENEYRAVFAVDKLNEGWDVLNLFDIVRLYNTRDAKRGKPGKTTMAEAQLIGRGARYCPFKVSAEQKLFSRKYDDDVANELRICEELYYHSTYNPKYIQELNTALQDIGIKANQSIERSMKLKPKFKETSFYKNGIIYLNEQNENNYKDVFGLKSSLIEQTHKFTLKTGYTKSSIAFGNGNTATLDRKAKEYKITDFGEHIVRKALNKLDFYKFSNLKGYLPNLKSISEFITSENYLSRVRLEISGLKEQINNLTPKEKLDAVIKVLDNISKVLVSDKVDYKGSREFKPFLFKDKIIDKKVLNFTLSDYSDKEFGKSMNNPTETNYHLDLSKRDWYVFEDCYGTSEEKLLIKFIDKAYEKLKPKFDKIFLVRNERYLKIYNFDDGRPIEPDFILFLVNHQLEESFHYQIFIEPKGEHLLNKDEWKEKFLLRLRSDHNLVQLWKGKNYIIWGMPFYNELHTKNQFEKAFNKIFE
jgi:type III restriction enzyme